jgi:hypothetical protein
MAISDDRTRGALQTIFSFFLGLMVLAFIAVGVNTFYQAPSERYQKEQQDISRKMEALNVRAPGGATLSSTDQAELKRLQDQQNALQDGVDAEQKIWGRNTSIVLVLFATLVMGISLIRSEELRVVSNGLLLGGLFTMLYGSGWVIFTGTSTARFLVILFAFAITVGLGYVKFVRQRREPVAVAAGEGPAVPAAELGGLEARIAALEERQAAAAAALGAQKPARDA